MNASSRSLFLALPLFATLSFARPALAGDAAAAEALFNEARRLMSQGNFQAACPQLEESQKLDPGMGTLFNLGDCYEKVGRTASAWAAFLDVAAQAKNAGQAARETDARSRAQAIEPKLSRLTITVEGDPASTANLVVKRDGQIGVGRAQWGLALPIDPGEHVVEASAPGKLPFTGKVQIAPNGQNAKLVVPALESAPVAPVRAPVAPPPKEAEAPSESSVSQRTLGLVVGGVGVVGLGVGAVFGLQSMGKKGDADNHCNADNFCDATGLSARKDALSAGTLSTVFVVAGAALAAGGAVLFFTAPNKDPKRAARFAPVALPSGGALTVTGSFR